MDNNIYIYNTGTTEYPGKTELFRPSSKYPEYLFKEISSKSNPVYDALRELFHMRHMDDSHFNTTEWNPLGVYIKPDDKVVVKPNLVSDKNYGSDGSTECLYTNPSVCAALIDYIIIALNGQGKIIVGDAPVQECNFDKLVNESGYSDLVAYYQNQGVDIELKDFRADHAIVNKGIYQHIPNSNFQEVIVDLKDQSEFESLSEEDMKKLRVTNFDPRVLQRHQHRGKHEYSIAKDLLDADVVFDVPKVKTHRKGGVTISLKNMIGGNCKKEYLPHHMNGDKQSNSGDEYRKRSFSKKQMDFWLDRKNLNTALAKSFLTKFDWFMFRGFHKISQLEHDKTYDGSWSGNNTISRTIIDINKILNFADSHGELKSTRQRKILVLADIVIAGQGEGPMCPESKKVGCIAFGENQYTFDRGIALMMGAILDKIPMFIQFNESKSIYKLDVTSNYKFISNTEINGKTEKEISQDEKWNFKPASDWEDAFFKYGNWNQKKDR